MNAKKTSKKKSKASPRFGKTIFTGDCLGVMRGFDSDSIDLIYLDPPFNSNANYAAPIGSKAAGAEFKDTWNLSDIDLEWVVLLEKDHPELHAILTAIMNKSDKSYLIYMAIRILEMRRILKPTGSIYLHCDPTMSHYLKIVMDAIFGRKNCRNEIVWCYTGPSNNVRYFKKKHDIILYYSIGDTWVFNADKVRIPYTRLNTQKGGGSGGIGGDMDEGKVASYVAKGKVPEDWWPDISPVGRIKGERIKYPTQKPLALLRRIIQASSNPGDLVLDPFCGCATTCVAADGLNRSWIGIDVSDKAVELVAHRIKDIQGGLIEDISHWDTAENKNGLPRRTDLGKLPSTKSQRERLYELQNGVCNGCGQNFPIKIMEVDHIIAISKGGTDHPENLQMLCSSCNRIKGNRGMEYLKSSLRLKERLNLY